ncbi:MAG TPA: nickel-binding protein [Candidatus Krumholzibacteria bacterium]|nr:nickel-binding protein [Candidatus Krumholzibacteria bacterium]
MKTYAIRRRSGWESTRELEVAGKRSARVGSTMPDKVRWIRSYAVVEEDGRIGTVCIYQAVSPEAIREHAAAAELPATEINEVAATIVVNEDPVAV